VLVFSATEGFRHESIAAGVAAVRSLGARHGFAVDATEDPSAFTDRRLARYAAVVWLNTTGDVLDGAQQGAFRRYVRRGGGFAGVHSAADTEYGWRWYGRLLGARFRRHPAVQSATIRVVDRRHPSTRALPRRWQRTDEWYDFRAQPRRGVRVLALLDEGSYAGGSMGARHPIAWYRRFQGGRSWYTALGHTAESYAEPRLRAHLLGGIRWAAGR
jgi:type 1 glutamine amidotransferase